MVRRYEKLFGGFKRVVEEGRAIGPFSGMRGSLSSAILSGSGNARNGSSSERQSRAIARASGAFLFQLARMEVVLHCPQSAPNLDSTEERLQERCIHPRNTSSPTLNNSLPLLQGLLLQVQSLSQTLESVRHHPVWDISRTRAARAKNENRGEGTHLTCPKPKHIIGMSQTMTICSIY